MPSIPLKFKARAEPEKISAGELVKVIVEIEIAEGCYIESSNPAEKFMIPTKLSVLQQEGLSIAEIIYPEAKIKEVSWAKKQLSVYEGSFKIEAEIKVNDSCSAGEKYIKGKLSYQPCTENACMMPRSEDFEVKIEVVR